VVRSDLLVLTGGTALEGFEIHWFQQGIHLSGQHPTLDVGVGARPDPDGYQRVTALADRDASALVGLPDGTDVGQVTRSQPGERPGDLLIEASAREAGAWLLVTSSWHPGWQALLDGKPVDVAMLAPGWLGVRLPLGEHRVALSWRPAGWLGAWAAANAACYLALVGVLLGRLRRRTRP